jgi:hypothetical protein
MYEYNSIHREYSFRMTSIYPRDIVTVAIAVAVSTYTEVAESCANAVGPKLHAMHWNTFEGILNIGQGFGNSVQKYSASSSDE